MLKKVISFIILLNFIVPFNEAAKRNSSDNEESGHSTTKLVACSAGAVILGMIISKAISHTSAKDSNENAKIEDLEKKLMEKQVELVEALEKNLSLAKEKQTISKKLSEMAKELKELAEQKLKTSEQKVKLRLDLALLKAWSIPQKIMEKADKDPALHEDIEAIQQKIDEQIQRMLQEHCQYT